MNEDKEERGLQELQSCDWIRGLLGNDSGKISWNNFLDLMPLKNYGILSESSSLDDKFSGYGYCGPSDGSFMYGVFISLYVGGTRLQIKSDINSGSIKCRTCNFNGDFSSWKLVSFT